MSDFFGFICLRRHGEAKRELKNFFIILGNPVDDFPTENNY